MLSAFQLFATFVFDVRRSTSKVAFFTDSSVIGCIMHCSSLDTMFTFTSLYVA
ncbi:MAG: hypothetical protein ACRCYY_08445 [Trueperaceae bacterium]